MAFDGGEQQPAPRRTRRRFFAPEVIQTSAMDCGPAALKCLLEGHGISVSYGRLREACQTSVDGTSIDTMETVARMLGLDAEQVMVPIEHLVAPSAHLLPAIAVVRLASGMTHFVVVWRQLGPYLQLMDPARGRRWVRTEIFLRDLHLHTQGVDAVAFQAFVRDAGFTEPVAWRLAGVVGRTRAAAWQPRIAAAQADGSWRSLGRLDGAIRALGALVAAGTIRRGAEADDLLRALLSTGPDQQEGPQQRDRRDNHGSALGAVIDAHSCARPGPADEQGAEQVRFTGAVLVRVAGVVPSPTPPVPGADPPTDGEPPAAPAAIPIELLAALEEKPVSVVRSLTAFWSAGARTLAIIAAVLALVAATGGILEVLLARPLLSGSDAPAAKATAIAPGIGAATPSFIVLCLVVLAMCLVELPLAFASRRLGRGLDQGLRRAFLRKLPLLGDRYFSSRPVSDMAERAHLLHRVRLLPALISEVGRCWFELGLMAAALAWLYPPGTPLVLALFAFLCVVPLLFGPALAERDLRMRTHSGSLTQFYVDALLGLSAAKIHRAERALVSEHGARLLEWRQAGRDLVRASLAVEAAVVLAAALGAAVLVIGGLRASEGHYLGGPGGGAAGLLLLFFALGLPTQAARLTGLWRQLPDYRNVTLRLLEPLGAPEERRAPAAPAGFDGATGDPADEEHADAVSIALDGVSVEAGGHRVLSDVSLTIPAGSHVAVVGTSGAGKSTLIGLLLGFHVPVAGRVSVDGADLNGADAALARLRRRTVWIEPGVQLWNRSLAFNVVYGAASAPTDEDLARAIADAELSELVARWSEGTRTVLGEGGGLLSGGEGQRVRIARELMRVRRPRLVLLDEPFRGLDGETRLRLMARLRTRWADTTLIAATHDIEQTRSFPRVLVIADGQIVEDGAPEELAADLGSRYRALLDSEARVRTERWSSSVWKRWLVRDGAIVANES